MNDSVTEESQGQLSGPAGEILNPELLKQRTEKRKKLRSGGQSQDVAVVKLHYTNTHMRSVMGNPSKRIGTKMWG